MEVILHHLLIQVSHRVRPLAIIGFTRQSEPQLELIGFLLGVLDKLFVHQNVTEAVIGIDEADLSVVARRAKDLLDQLQMRCET